MKARVRLLRQVGAGKDGASWAARDEETGRLLTLHRLAPLSEDVLRLRALAARVRLLELVAKQHVTVVREASLDTSDPWILVERVERTLGDVLLDGAMNQERFLPFAERLVQAVVEAHRLGIAHGGLRPGSISVDDEDRPTIELLDLDTGGRPASPFDVQPRDERISTAADVAALADVLQAARTGRPPGARTTALEPSSDAATATDDLDALFTAMRAADPSDRPTASEVLRRLVVVVETQTAAGETANAPHRTTETGSAVRIEQLGRYRLLELLGEGAMGTVYRAEDVSDGTIVAVKLLSREHLRSPRALRRFRKEARLLAEVKNPFVANILEANEDDGRHFIAVEYVRGRALALVLQERGPMSERDALSVVADLCRALVDVHGRGVVHRDIKPDNVLLLEGAGSALGGRDTPRVKLIDFGIARHVDETESLAMTRDGALIGTPLYMSPEQCRGDAVDVRTDVYALGTTLFELLVGRAPFAGKGTPLVVISQQQTAPPKVDELKPEVSAATTKLVARMLEKERDRRPADARAVLAAVEEILGGAGAVAANPKAPASISAVKSWSIELDLKSSPRELWPYVSNTERLNKAAGLGEVEESSDADGGFRQGKARAFVIDLRWKENPFEWIEGRRLGVLREYTLGPLAWMKGTVELSPNADGGTRLVQTVAVEPRGLLARAAASLEIGVRTMRAFEKLYRRIDDLLQRRRSGEHVDDEDAFEARFVLPRDRALRVAQLERRAVEEGAAPVAVAALGEFLRSAPAQDVSRIRPIALARRLGVGEADMVKTCLVAAHAGLLVPLWDLLCPGCRAPAQIEETLRAVKDHGRCDVCAIDFAIDLATSIEMVFRVHPSLRDADTATYCISSPAHTPHVAAQVRIAPGEKMQLDLGLEEGAYLLLGARLPFRAAFQVRAGAPATRWDVSLQSGPDATSARILGAGEQTMVLVNDTGKEQLVRVERSAARDDALTAARAVANPLFRRLFPTEVIDDGALLRVGSVTLLLADAESGDARDTAALQRTPDDGNGVEQRAFASLYAAFKSFESAIALHGGSVVKLRGDGVLACFDDPADAVRAALALPTSVEAGRRPSVRVAVHRGPAAAVTLNDRLDYFGRTVKELEHLLERAAPGELVVSEQASLDPVVARILLGRGVDDTILEMGGAPAHRFALQDAPGL